MKRQHPFISTYGMLSTALLLGFFGLLFWQRGQLIFSPGQLSDGRGGGLLLAGFASHADFEAQCRRCHQPLATTQDRLCLDCHTEVAGQIAAGEGAHGSIEKVAACAACHSDHQGRLFDMLASAYPHFDHEQTAFSLVWHQLDYQARPMACAACHRDQARFVSSSDGCLACHQDGDRAFMDRHSLDFGNACLSCHNGQDNLGDFDHSQTAFELQGKHRELPCADCHPGPRPVQPVSSDQTWLVTFAETPQECQACHAEPELHRRLFSLDCAGCHSPTSWSPALYSGSLFAHSPEAVGFSLARHALDYQGDPINCVDCHGDNPASFDPLFCRDCHLQADPGAFDLVQHEADFGSGCIQCHDGVDRMSGFDHAAVFPLEGGHFDLACEDCHAGQVFAATSQECQACHAEPEVHAGSFGTQCAYCHDATSWTPARLRVHNFSLDHGDQGELACEVCHNQRYSEYTCYGCHEHQPDEILAEHLEEGISREEIASCIQCHPTGTENE